MDMFSPSPVQVRRWLQDEDRSALLRLAIPGAGVELTASLVGLRLGSKTCYSLLVYFENERNYLEYCTPLNVSSTAGADIDCAQSLQTIASSKFFAESISAPFVARLRAEGMLPAQG